MYTYTFNRLADVPPDHVGFWLTVTLCVFIIAMDLCAYRERLFTTIFILAIPLGFTYWVSFHATSQEPQVFANIPVIAELVGFQPEGSRELVKSGKSQSYVDRHKVYVIYSVAGTQVILRADTGVEYPKTVVLYRN